MTRENAPETFTIRTIQDRLGLTRSAVSGLIAAGFVSPTRGQRNEYRFTFQDLVLLRTAVELRDAKVPPRKILNSLRRLRSDLPADVPVTGLRITAIGNEVTVRDRGSPWQPASGQLVMDFELAPLKGSVTYLDRAPASDHRESPARSFSEGETLEATDKAAAEAAYRRALVLDANFADAYLNLGALLCERNRSREALALYDEAVRRFPNEPLLHFNRAVALEDEGRAAEALASYNICLRLDPKLADAHFNVARLHEQLGDSKQAVRHFSAYRRLSL